jgi:hypothetical protein
MLRIDLVLQEARDRQAALRPARRHAVLAARPNAIRRLVGGWLVRAGRVVAGHPTAHARLA